MDHEKPRKNTCFWQRGVQKPRENTCFWHMDVQKPRENTCFRDMDVQKRRENRWKTRNVACRIDSGPSSSKKGPLLPPPRATRRLLSFSLLLFCGLALEALLFPLCESQRPSCGGPSWWEFRGQRSAKPQKDVSWAVLPASAAGVGIKEKGDRAAAAPLHRSAV